MFKTSKKSILAVLNENDAMEISLDPDRYTIIQIEECKSGYIMEYIDKKGE